MLPGKYNLTIYRGATWSRSIAAQDENNLATDFGANYDEIRMQIRPPWVKEFPTSTPLLELTQANGRISLEGDNTQIVLYISAADTAVLDFDEGHYELELVKHATTDPIADEVVDKLLIGSVTVLGEVTV